MKQGSEPIGTHGLVGHASVFQLSWSDLLFRQLDGREMGRGVVAGFGSASYGLFGVVAVELDLIALSCNSVNSAAGLASPRFDL